MTQQNEIVIRSEQDAYDALELAGQGKLPDHVSVHFEGWPRLEIVVRGEEYNGTITPSLMAGFMEFQKAIYRTYALTRYNSVNINRLTNQEKDALELHIQVDKGSSKFTIDFQALLERFIDNVGDKVTPESLVIIALIVATGYFGSSILRHHLDNRREIRLKELESKQRSEERRQELEAQQYAGEQETERMRIFAAATRNEPKAANIREYAEDAQLELVKSMRKVDSSSIGGVELDGDMAQELTKNARREAKEIRLDGLYRVQVVDASKIDVFKIKIRDAESGDEFIATVQDETLDNRHREAIREAEWAKKPVQLSINARAFGDEIRSAVVISAKKAIEK